MSSPHPTPHSLTHSLTHSLILTLTLLTLSLPSTHATPLTHTHTALSDLVTSMPGLHTNSSSLNFSMFSGFFEITSTNLLYYSLTESQGDPSEDPLVIWLNAGPGCSGMVSYMSEFGPFRVSVRTSEEDMSLTLLEHNPYSWNHFGKQHPYCLTTSLPHLFTTSHTYSLALPYYLTTSLPHTHPHSLALPYYLTASLPHTHTLTRSALLPHCLATSHTHSLALPHYLTYTHSLTCASLLPHYITHTHTHTHSRCLTRASLLPHWFFTPSLALPYYLTALLPTCIHSIFYIRHCVTPCMSLRHCVTAPLLQRTYCTSSNL